MEVGLGPGHIVLDRGTAPLPPKRDTAPQFLVHVYCGQTAGWIKTPLGTEVDLGPCHFVLDRFPAIGEIGKQTPSFRPIPIVATVAISATAKLLYVILSSSTTGHLSCVYGLALQGILLISDLIVG